MSIGERQQGITPNGMGLYARSRCAVAQALAGYGVKPLL